MQRLDTPTRTRVSKAGATGLEPATSGVIGVRTPFIRFHLTAHRPNHAVFGRFGRPTFFAWLHPVVSIPFPEVTAGRAHRRSSMAASVSGRRERSAVCRAPSIRFEISAQSWWFPAPFHASSAFHPVTLADHHHELLRVQVGRRLRLGVPRSLLGLRRGWRLFEPVGAMKARPGPLLTSPVFQARPDIRHAHGGRAL